MGVVFAKVQGQVLKVWKSNDIKVEMGRMSANYFKKKKTFYEAVQPALASLNSSESGRIPQMYITSVVCLCFYKHD
jgi:hypothetical protein